MNFTDTFTAIKHGAMVITVNQRLARHLVFKVEQEYLAEGCVAWPSPRIIAYDTWLLECWQSRFMESSSEESKRLLTPEQSLVLWEQVIKQADESVLLNVSATAKAAASASRLAYQWDIPVNLSGIGVMDDLAAFSRWHNNYSQQLIANNWVDRAQLPTLILEGVEQQQINLPEKVIFAGFDVFTPLQQRLISVLESQNKAVELLENSKPKIQVVQTLSATDSLDEAMCAAQWAREYLTAKPDCSIGVIVPELESKRDIMERAFQAVFYPDSQYPTDVPFNKPYNVSLGRPLSYFAPVKQAFRWLCLFSHELTLSELSSLLRSPFIQSGESEWNSRAQLEVELRNRGFLTITAAQLQKRLLPKEALDEPRSPQLLLAINSLLKHQKARPNRVKPSAWALIFRGLLADVGWQGEREINSLEYQVMHAWDELLQVFSRLDAVLDVINLQKAVSTLNKLSNERVFQPETPHVPIQVMGLMEAAGHTFDGLWVCGLNDKAWPVPMNPNPFLAISEQRKQGLVQASAERQYKLAKTMTDNWTTAADTVIFSYPLFDGDMPCLQSPLIQSYTPVEKGELLKHIATDPLLELINTAELLEVSDETAPALKKKSHSGGGVSLIKDQSACPFKAFAHHRLAARGLEEPEAGLDMRERGNIVHSCLEEVWKRIKTHQQLVELTEEEQGDIVSNAVEETLTSESRHNPVLTGNFAKLEAKRLRQLVLEWLQLDKAREPFTVMKTEFKQAISVGDLSINTTIDRVDKLDDGSMAIIDYKTGSVSTSSWFSDRPEDPQLPLYGVFAEHNVGSISFAQVKKGECKYAGVTDSDDAFSALKPIQKEKYAMDDWDSQIDSWNKVLTGIANEFVAGHAAVDPTKKACAYCDLTPLCRINEQLVVGEGE